MKNNFQDSPIGISQAEEILELRKKGKDKLYKIENGSVVVDHVRTANALAMFISNIPMDKWIKKIMIMRIGSPLLNHKAMSHMQIALKLGMTEAEVKEIEEEGIKICNDYMSRVSVAESQDKNNKGIIIDTLNDINQ